MSDLISRQDAIDAVDSETVSTNPEHFKSSEKFIKFMDDVDIASFGQWQWANGFNTALVATRVQLKKLPSAQQEPQWIPCSERLPEDGTYVLGYMAYGQCSVLKCEGGRLYTAGCWVPLPKNAVTHWQPLPDAPKGEEE